MDFDVLQLNNYNFKNTGACLSLSVKGNNGQQILKPRK